MSKKKFNNILITSDFDATFFDRGFIPPRNITAVDYFIENGGRFTINTARPVSSIAEYLHLFKINAPAALCNGAVVYDYEAQAVLHAEYFTPRALGVAREVYEKFPGARIELYTDTQMKLARDLPILPEKSQRTRPRGEPVDIHTFEGNLCRITYLAEKQITAEIAEFVMSKSGGEFDGIPTEGRLFTITPSGITKGFTLVRIAEILGIPIENTYCIGDGNNDIGMMKSAGVAVCPNNAVQAVKDLSDVIVCGMADGAVADLIEYIEKKIDGETEKGNRS